jgi:hypothetical protein
VRTLTLSFDGDMHDPADDDGEHGSLKKTVDRVRLKARSARSL